MVRFENDYYTSTYEQLKFYLLIKAVYTYKRKQKKVCLP